LLYQGSQLPLLAVGFAKLMFQDTIVGQQRLHRWTHRILLDQEPGVRTCAGSPAPTHRQQGIGRLLVDEILKWAARRKARILQLMVTSNNEPAILFYERLGFARTGSTKPCPNDPAVSEYEMSKSIS
jgi:ribosomal protein S18 acetylase RimI-like enzyme